MPITERQQKLIDKCKAAGYGWEKFASSVEKSGHCTQRQEDTLCTMSQRIDRIRHQHQMVRKHGWVGTDWDECNLDAASAGYESNDS